MEQVKNSFDVASLKKIAHGALISVGGAAAIALLNYIGALHIDNPNTAAFIAWLIPTLINVVKEFIAGEQAKQ